MIYTKDNYVLSSGESYEQSHIMSEKIVFIHSLGRSGSTFLQKLFVDLGGSDFYCYPKEWNVMEKYHRALDADGMQVLGQLVEMYREDSKSDKKIVELLDALASSELEKKVTVCEFLGVIKQLVSAGNDNSFMIIKTTDLDNYWLYVKYMPSSKSIINIRNPLDYIHSWHMFWMRSNYPIWPTHWDRPLHVEALERLKACFLQAWVYRSMENVRIVKMEEIESFDENKMVCLFRELVIFVGLPERGESEYRQAIKKRSGVNESVKMSIMDKRNFYRSLGLCGMERKVLKELAVYSVPFYPDYNDMIGSVKNSNYVVRYLKYLYVFNKQNKTITLMLPIKALKRLLSLVKLVSCK